tara:strand:+ start:4153 stop:4908 length:756 start_codon:yes stop_codon:yes gene_type:complete
MHSTTVESSEVQQEERSEVNKDFICADNCGICCIDLHEQVHARWLVDESGCGVCPNLMDDRKCSMYEERPRECRLPLHRDFDYTAWCKRQQDVYKNIKKYKGITCRFASPEEIDIVGYLWKELMVEQGHEIKDKQLQQFKVDLATRIGNMPACSFVAYKDKKAIGMLTGGLANTSFDTENLIAGCEYLYVVPEHRNGEVFAALEQEATRWAVRTGVKTVEIYVPLERRKVYQRRGYTPEYLRMKKILGDSK